MTPVDYLSIWISLVSLSSVILLYFQSYHPLPPLLIASVTTLVLILHYRPKITINRRLILILLLSIIFRYPPYIFIAGGQDQGTYSNMAQHYLHYGTSHPIDKVRQQLNQNQQEIYDRLTPGLQLPGINQYSSSQSKYQFQFYPLHSLWLATSSHIFGNTNAPIYLTLFSLLTIYFVYHLVLLLTKQKVAATLAALFFATNPALVYFSKLPLSETTLTFFLISGFYYLLRYYLSSPPRQLIFYLTAASFCQFYLTHISGFLVFPLILLLTVIAAYFRQYAVSTLLYVLLLLHAISIYYGMFFAPLYSLTNYHLLLGKYLGSNWRPTLRLIYIFLLTLPPIFAIFTLRLRQQITDVRFSKLLSRLLLFLFLGILAAAAFQTYRLSFTSTFNNPVYNNNQWQLSSQGWGSIKFSSLFVYIQHLSPIGFLLLPLSFLFITARRQPTLIIYCLIFIGFLFYRLCLTLVVPYQPYFVRYLSEELIPLSLILIATYLSHLLISHKLLAKTLIFCILAYFVIFSIPLVFHREGDGLYQSLSPIADIVKTQDLLIINYPAIFIVKPTNPFNYNHYFIGEISTPLAFYFNLPTISINTAQEEARSFINNISSNYQHLYMLYDSEITRPYLKLIKVIHFKHGLFEQSNFFPLHFEYNQTQIFLYQVDPTKFEK